MDPDTADTVYDEEDASIDEQADGFVFFTSALYKFLDTAS